MGDAEEPRATPVRAGRRTVAVVALLGLLLGGCLWLRFGYEPDAGSHTLVVRHVEAAEAIDGSDFDPVAVRIGADSPGRSSYLFLGVWPHRGDSFLSSVPGEPSITYTGQFEGTDLIRWESSGPATIEIELDGRIVERIQAQPGERGAVELDLDLSLPASSWLLLIVSIGWGTTAVIAIGRLGRNRRVARSPTGAGIAVIGLVVTMTAVAATVAFGNPRVLPTDIVVDPAPTVDTAVRLTDRSGAPLALPSLNASPGWAFSDTTFTNRDDRPLRWRLDTASGDRLVLDANGPVDVTVDGRRTALDGADVRLDASIDDLADRSVGERLPELAARLAGGPIAAALILLLVLGGERLARIVTTRQREPDDIADRSTSAPWRQAVGYAAVPASVWTTLVVVMWPGFVSPDAYVATTWFQDWATGDIPRIPDWHPWPTTVWFGVTELVAGPWLPILIVVALLSMTIGVLLASAGRLGAPPAVVWGSAVLVAVMPSTAFVTASLWKDTITGLGIVALTAIVWRIVQTDGAWLLNARRHLAIAVAVCLTIWLSRHNGWPIVVASLATVALAVRSARRGIALLFVATAAIALTVRIPVAELFDVAPNRQTAIAYLQRVSAHIEAGTAIDDDDREFLESIRPLDEPWPYDCLTVQETWAGPDAIPLVDYVFVESELRSVWLRLAAEAPRVEWQHLTCSTQILWNPFDGSSYTYVVDGWSGPGFVDAVPNSRADQPTEAHPSRRQALRVRMALDDVPAPLTRPAIGLYLLVGALALDVVRNRRVALLLVASPAVWASASMIPFSFVQDTRFHYGLLLVSFTLAPTMIWMAITRTSLRRADAPDDVRDDADTSHDADSSDVVDTEDRAATLDTARTEDDIGDSEGTGQPARRPTSGRSRRAPTRRPNGE